MPRFPSRPKRHNLVFLSLCFTPTRTAHKNSSITLLLRTLRIHASTLTLILTPTSQTFKLPKIPNFPKRKQRSSLRPPKPISLPSGGMGKLEIDNEGLAYLALPLTRQANKYHASQNGECQVGKGSSLHIYIHTYLHIYHPTNLSLANPLHDHLPPPTVKTRK